MLLSDYNQITDNIFFNTGFYVYRSLNNTVKNNIVNGKPIVYLEDKSNDIITNAGQVICINCDDITIENQILTNTYIGVELWGSTNCYISNNDCSNNNFGIYLLYTSNNNTIIQNTIANNDNGIYLNIDCNYNLIKGNTISHNQISGIELIGCKYNTIERNQISRNFIGITLKPYIGWGYYTDSERNTIYKNNFIRNILDATFHYSSKDFSLNSWSWNYWRIFKLLPKLIFGKIGISPESLWINIDWRPSLIPNIIK